MRVSGLPACLAALPAELKGLGRRERGGIPVAWPPLRPTGLLACLPAPAGRAERAWEERKRRDTGRLSPLEAVRAPRLSACPTGRTERAWEERKRRDSGRLSCLPRFGCRLGVWPTWSFPDGILADPCKQGNSACMRVKMGLDSPHRSPGLYYRGRCCAVSRSNGQKSQKCDSRSIVARKQRVSMLKRLGIRVG